MSVSGQPSEQSKSTLNKRLPDRCPRLIYGRHRMKYGLGTASGPHNAVDTDRLLKWGGGGDDWGETCTSTYMLMVANIGLVVHSKFGIVHVFLHEVHI